MELLKKSLIAAVGLAAFIVLSALVMAVFAVRVIHTAINRGDVIGYAVGVGRALDVALAYSVYQKRGWTLSMLAHYHGKKHRESKILEVLIDIISYPFDGWGHCRDAYLSECRKRGVIPYGEIK